MRHEERFIDTEEGKEVAERILFFRQIHNGNKKLSCEQIARLLNGEGHQTMEGKPFSHWMVRYYLRQVKGS